MKTLQGRLRLIALVPLVAIAILSIGNRTGAVADQNREVREAANEVGIIIEGSITPGQVFRFNVAHELAGPGGGPHILELTVFDSQGNVVATHQFQFPNSAQNQSNNTWRSQSFDLNGGLLGSNTYDSAGRAELTGVVKHVGTQQSGGIPGGGCVVSGEIFRSSDVNGDGNDHRTLVYIAGVPITESRNR